MTNKLHIIIITLLLLVDFIADESQLTIGTFSYGMCYFIFVVGFFLKIFNVCFVCKLIIPSQSYVSFTLVVS